MQSLATIVAAIMAAAVVFTIFFFGWFRDLTKEVHELALTIAGWRPFMEGIMRRITDDAADRIYPQTRPPHNPGPANSGPSNSGHDEMNSANAEQREVILPDKLREDIEAAVRAKPPNEWRSALVEVLNGTYGAAKIGLIATQVGSDIDHFLEAAVKLARKVSLETRSGT